jgi:hypothetical protein
MKNKKLKWAVVILIVVLLFPSCTGKAGAQTGGGKSINSATELKEYLDKQPANSPDKPIKVAMKVNDMMIKDIVKVLNEAGKYVSLDLSGSPLTEIPEKAFQNCKTLAGIIIPNSVTSIRKDAFYRCTSLTKVTIPNSVTTIENHAFNRCESLTSVTIPNNVTRIWVWAFDSCTNLTSVTFQGKTSELFTVGVGIGGRTIRGPFGGDLREKYLAGGIGTYTTTTPVNWESKWTKQ